MTSMLFIGNVWAAAEEKKPGFSVRDYIQQQKEMGQRKELYEPLSDDESRNLSMACLFGGGIRLDLTDKGLTSLDGMEQIPCAKFVRVLGLGNNELTKLDKNSFKNFSRLDFIFLRKNKLETIDEGTFSDLPKLYVLNLMDNQLQRIDASMFSKCPLNQLYLGNNELKEVDHKIFEILPNLADLGLEENKLSTEQIESLKKQFDNNIARLKGKFDSSEIKFRAKNQKVD